MADVALTEEELAIEIWDFDVIIVGVVNFTLGATSDAHECEGFDKFAAERTRANHESIYVEQLFLSFTTEYFNLVVVSAAHWRSVDNFIRQSLETIVVQPLLKRGVFASEFDNFLGDDST